MSASGARSFPYVKPPELAGGPVRRRPVAVVGAGPIGLAAAIDLALHGIPVVLLDESDAVSTGSRAICWAKRTLEICDRLGIGERMIAKGVTWKIGRVYHGERELYSFDLLPEDGHRMPAFVNLQQHDVEEFLIERAADFPGLIDLRWRNRVVSVVSDPERVRLGVETPDGRYEIESDWVIAADGAKSTLRRLLGLPFAGMTFDERFLIVDVRMEADFPGERRFWFRPVFHSGESVLMHRQPGDVFRIDFQLGPEADPDEERRPENVIPRVKAIVGETPFSIEWCSVYSFRCARLEKFVHGRIVFAGDSAHVVSPFGARGGNGGMQDVDNLAWKLALVLRGEAPDRLIETYDEERGRGADENDRHSRRTTCFMTPKTPAERLFRDSVLALAETMPFARRLVNGGRLSQPCGFAGLTLQTPETEAPEGAICAGMPCLAAPVLAPDGRPGWLLNHLGGRFAALVFVDSEENIPDALPPDLGIVVVSRRAFASRRATVLVDAVGHARARYGGLVHLIRPDQHVAATFPSFDAPRFAAAYDRARGL